MATTTKPTKPTRYFYAVSHLYGRGTTTDSRRTGEVVPAVNVHRFTSAAAARAWAAGGSDYRREQDYREVLSDATRYVQRYVRRELARARASTDLDYIGHEYRWCGGEVETDGEALS